MNESFVRAVERARGYIECARSLFRDGFLLECHDYMVKALRLQLDAWAGVEAVPGSVPAEPGTALERALRALERAGYRRVDRLRATASVAEQPLSAAGARPSSADFDPIWAEVERLARFSAHKALTPHARKLQRWRRGVLAGLLLASVLLVCMRLWGRPRVRASAIISEEHSAANVIDGLEATEWLLPDSVPGWVDVMFPTARSVHRVRLVNAHNTFYADRATHAVRVTAFTEQGPVASVEGAFAHFSDEHSELDLPLEARQVTRVRVEVLSHFRTGGGLADVEIE